MKNIKKLFLLILSAFFISSPCFWAVVDLSNKGDIDKITDVSIVNADLNKQSLVENINLVWASTISIFKTVLNWILVIFVVYIWVSMIISMWTNEDRLSGAKRQFYYSLTWLLFLNVPEMLFNATSRWKLDESWKFILDWAKWNLTSDVAWFTSSGTTFLWSENFAAFVWWSIISFMEVIIFGSALFVFILAWIRVIKSRWKEEDLTEWKFKFSYWVAGLVFVSIIEVYKNVVFNVNIDWWQKIYEQMLSIWAYFLAPLAFFTITLGWYYYLISWGDETKMNKWKNIILYTLFWILVYLASWSILAELNF